MEHKCKTCRHWVAPGDYQTHFTFGVWDLPEWGACRLTQDTGEHAPEHPATLAWTADDETRMPLRTKADFGCVQWEQEGEPERGPQLEDLEALVRLLIAKAGLDYEEALRLAKR